MTSSSDSLATASTKTRLLPVLNHEALDRISLSTALFLRELSELSLPRRDHPRQRHNHRDLIRNNSSNHSWKSKRKYLPPQGNLFSQPRHRPQGLGQLFYRGVIYASCHEAACGELMERYIPGFKVIDGRTFQIPILEPATGKVRTVDFFVNGHLFEYHPPRFRSGRGRYGDFASLNEYLRFKRKMHSGLSKEEKHRLIQETRALLALSYARKRREIIDNDPRFRGTPLITASSPAEFYGKVICRFGVGYPSKQKFLNIFYAIVREVFEKNRFLKRRGKYRYVSPEKELRRSA